MSQCLLKSSSVNHIYIVVVNYYDVFHVNRKSILHDYFIEIVGMLNTECIKPFQI